jgi:hypothetical protein
MRDDDFLLPDTREVADHRLDVGRWRLKGKIIEMHREPQDVSVNQNAFVALGLWMSLDGERRLVRVGGSDVLSICLCLLYSNKTNTSKDQRALNSTQLLFRVPVRDSEHYNSPPSLLGHFI